jgi:hypothetical protein
MPAPTVQILKLKKEFIGMRALILVKLYQKVGSFLLSLGTMVVKTNRDRDQSFFTGSSTSTQHNLFEEFPRRLRYARKLLSNNSLVEKMKKIRNFNFFYFFGWICLLLN